MTTDNRLDLFIVFNLVKKIFIEEGGGEHQFDFPPNIPHYSTLPNDLDRSEDIAKSAGMTAEQFRAFYLIFGTDVIQTRTPDLRSVVTPGIHSPDWGFWFKFDEAIGDDPITHRTLLAFISDKALMSTALRPLPVNFRTHKVIGASLDHAMWFHTPIDFSEWHLYDLDAPWTGGARGFNRGAIFSHTGELVASVAQEGLMRPLSKK